IEVYRRAVRGFRLDRLSGRSQQYAQIAMGIRMAWIDCDRTPVGGDCQVQLGVRLEYDAKVAVPVRLIGHKREASLDKLDGFADLPLLMRQHTRVVQRAGMIGRNLKDAAVQFVSFREMLVLLQEDGERHRFLESQFPRQSC